MNPPSYTLEQLKTEMKEVDLHLDRSVDAFLIGGCAMSYGKLKTTTKDIDLVLQSEKDLQRLEEGLRGARYKRVTSIDGVYGQLAARAIYDRPKAPRWDLYVEVVCNKLRLSPGMMSRSVPVEDDFAKLRIHRLAPQDIFIFKSITERQADADDMAIIATLGIPWDQVLDEMRWQCANSTTAWGGAFAVAMKEFHQRGFSVPNLSELESLADQDVGDKMILARIRRAPSTLEDLVAYTKQDETWVAETIHRLKERGLILEKKGMWTAAGAPPGA